jgi:hypothetical protein
MSVAMVPGDRVELHKVLLRAAWIIVVTSLKEGGVLMSSRGWLIEYSKFFLSTPCGDVATA